MLTSYAESAKYLPVPDGQANDGYSGYRSTASYRQ
jgi:hypothetical protein